MTKKYVVLLSQDLPAGVYQIIPFTEEQKSKLDINVVEEDAEEYVTAKKHKLTNDQVAEIRKKYATKKYGMKKLATMYGVSTDHIHQILNHLGRFAKV